MHTGVRNATPIVVCLALATGLAELSSRVGDWFVMTDELLYERLALSIDRLHSPLPHVHGVLVANINQLYPLVLAPVFARGTVTEDLHAAHILGAFVMASAGIPAALLARRVTESTAAAVLAAVLTVLVPWITLSSFLLTEVVGYPVFLWVLLACHSAVTRPSMANDLIALGAIVVAVTARVQFAVLTLVLAVAVALHGRGRKHRVLLVGYALGALAVLALVATGHNPLGTYGTTVHGDPFPPRIFPLLPSHLASVGLGVGLVPFILGGAWLAANAKRDAFATLAAASIVLVTIEVSSYDARFGGGLVRDRYLFYLAPIFAIAFAAALREVPRPSWIVALVVLLAAGLALEPLPLFDKLNVDTPVSVLDNYLRGAVDGPAGARLFLAAAAVVAGGLVLEGRLLLPRRYFVATLAVLAVASSLGTTGYAFQRLFAQNGTAGRPLTSDPGRVQAWVDRAVGSGSQVTEVPFPTVAGDYWSSAAYWWDVEFWNKSVDRSAGVPGEFEWTPSTFPKLSLRFDARGAASVSPPGYVLQAIGDTRFHLAGTVVLNNRSVFLVAPSRPWHADWSTTGLTEDGWTRPGVEAHIDVYPYPGQQGSVSRSLTVTVFAPAGVATRNFTLGAAAAAAGPNAVSQEVPVCVRAARATPVALKVDGVSAIPGDAGSIAAPPRSGGIQVARIYLSGSVTPGCSAFQVRKTSSSSASASSATSAGVSVPVSSIVRRNCARYSVQASQPATCRSKRARSAGASAPSR